MSWEWLPQVTMALIGLQGLLLVVDEVRYHRRRTLCLAEALGHPLDTALFLAAVLVAARLPPTREALWAYGVLAVLSSLAITKDEWIHARECEAAEHWLHALLFVVHGPILIAVAGVWLTSDRSPLLQVLPFVIGGWGLYQIFYWMRHHVRSASRRSRADAARYQQRILRRAR